MSEIRLNVRDARRELTATYHASITESLVAALSADPETIEELQDALGRFLPARDARRFFANWHSGTRTEPWDAGICFIDLAARVVMIGSTYSLPGRRGKADVADEAAGRTERVPYHLAEDWLFLHEEESWEAVAEERRQKRLSVPPLDARAVLYGKVCGFIAESAAKEEATEEAVSAIHARWLTEPRDDLKGAAPRDVLLSRRGHLSWDHQDREEQWSMLGVCPPGLSPETAAYRYGGFGTHEIVLYYKLVRFLLHAWFDRRQHANEEANGLPAPGADVHWLEYLRDSWLESPDYEDLHGRTPASVIARERARLPEGMTGAEAVVDHDCPMCQMMAEMPGPMFWSLDGSGMDDEFAFSFHRTREEWEAEQREYEEFSRRFNEERRSESSEAQSVWKTSYVNEQALGESPSLALFGLGAHLAELTQNLKDAQSEQGLIEQLHRDFGNVRDAVAGPTSALAEPVIAKMCESLADAAEVHADLADKCADLQRQLTALARRITGEPEWDEEMPF